MKGFTPLTDNLKYLLQKIVVSDALHARWINTLSYLENCGARKIAACEHPTLVKEEMLKHAAEEFRHAHYLKKQLSRLSGDPLQDYSLPNMLGGTSSLRYLTALDVQASRYLKRTVNRDILVEAAYVLVTYAIERRAAELYPLYDEVLRKVNSKITVKSILLEEQCHLLEMEKGLKSIPFGDLHAQHVCALESSLCKRWVLNLSLEIF